MGTNGACQVGNMRRERRGLELSAEGYLELAALNLEERSASLRHALEQVLRTTRAAGTALIRPRVDSYGPRLVEYVGPSKTEMLRWLSARLDDSFEITVQALRQRPPYLQRPPHLYDTWPLLFLLHPKVPIPGGIWILWSHRKPQSSSHTEELEDYRKGLEVLLEVEYKEQLYFHRADDPLEPQLRESIANGDGQALPTFLNIARMATDTGLTFWGDVANDVVEVAWHVGTMETGFGFELPVGEGVGGRAFAGQEVFHVADYLNCAYRYPGVGDVADKQGMRTVLAVPLRSQTPDAGAVIYGAKRRVSPFSAAQRILLFRLARSVEPLIGRRSVSRFYFPYEDAYLAEKRSELRRILLQSTRVQDIESWVERFVRGPAILTDVEERPYVLSKVDRFEELRRSSASNEAPPQTVALASHGASKRGHLHIWPFVPLPPAGWPDFLDDVATVCNIVLDRVERANDQLNRIRSRWLEEVMEKTTPQGRREGHRLGLPVDRGEVWALAWTGETVESANYSQVKLLVQDVALDQLGSPLILMEDDVGVFLLAGPAHKEPSAVRDVLLRVFAPAPLWLVHGAVYDSFEGLRGSLLRAVTTVKRLRQENNEQYVSDFGSLGLHSLLADPEVSENLTSFANDLLEPLLAYDSDKDSQLTETLALALTVGSTEQVANRLHVHPKTIRYRIRRAEEILGKDLNSPTDRTALSMAAFIWTSRQRKQPQMGNPGFGTR